MKLNHETILRPLLSLKYWPNNPTICQPPLRTTVLTLSPDNEPPIFPYPSMLTRSLNSTACTFLLYTKVIFFIGSFTEQFVSILFFSPNIGDLIVYLPFSNLIDIADKLSSVQNEISLRIPCLCRSSSSVNLMKSSGTVQRKYIWFSSKSVVISSSLYAQSTLNYVSSFLVFNSSFSFGLTFPCFSSPSLYSLHCSSM